MYVVGSCGWGVVCGVQERLLNNSLFGMEGGGRSGGAAYSEPWGVLGP